MARAGKKQAKKKITLAGPKPTLVRLMHKEQEDGRDKQGRPVYFTPVQPTPERLMQAGIVTVSNLDNKRMQVIANDQVGKDGVVRVASTTSPLHWLASRGMLDGNPERNTILLEAGKRYYSHWYLGGLRSGGSIDYNRIGGGTTDPSHMTPTSEFAAQHRAEYREARERMGGWLAKIADAVICEEMRLSEAAMAFGEYASPDTRSAIAVTMLRGALTTLADHFGMLRSGR
jgi:hypothetical protein